MAKKFKIIEGKRCDVSQGFPMLTEESDKAHWLAENIHRLEMKTRLSRGELDLLNKLQNKWVDLPLSEKVRVYG